MTVVSFVAKIVVGDHFHVALFSALKQTHCACMQFVILPEWLAFYSVFLNIHQSTLVYLQRNKMC